MHLGGVVALSIIKREGIGYVTGVQFEDDIKGSRGRRDLSNKQREAYGNLFTRRNQTLFRGSRKIQRHGTMRMQQNLLGDPLLCPPTGSVVGGDPEREQV